MSRVVRTVIAALALSAAAAPVAKADMIGPVYPAPGGTAFSATGSQIGQNPSPYSDRSYSGFDSTEWDALYWNITTGNIGNVFFSTDDPLTASYTLSGNMLTWFPTTNWSFPTAFGTVSTPVKLVTSFYEADGTTALTASDFLTAPEAGMPQVVLNVTPTSLAAWGGGFHVRVVYQTIGGIDASDFYNSQNTFGGFTTGTNAAFWYEEVPEPGALMLLGMGFLISASRLRARTRRSTAGIQA